MRLFATWVMLGTLCGGLNITFAQLEVVARAEPQRVFGGGTRTIEVWWRNAGNVADEADIQTRLMQLTSATAAPFEVAPWKRLQVLPGQTVVETVTLDFPAVKAETRFLVQWIEGSNQILGSTEVCVYPTNLLAELQSPVGETDGALGVFDPQNQIKPLLQNANVNFVDLENTRLKNFRGQSAIIGPFKSKAQMDCALAGKIKTLAENGVALVWIQPPAEDFFSLETKPVQPSFYSVPARQGAAVIVQPEMLADLARDPRSQLNLIYFCKQALQPQPLTLPSVKKQP
jgi:hypothetical protein